MREQFQETDRPLLCKVALPRHIKEAGIDEDLDCAEMPNFLRNRYTADFSSLEEAQKFVTDIQRPGSE